MNGRALFRLPIGKAWLRAKELVPLTAFLVTVTGLKSVKAPLQTMAQRLKRLLELSGSTMSVQYLKQATLAVYAWRVGKRLPGYTPGSPIVAMDKSGLPKIIPWPLRRLMPTKVWAVKVALTLLALYRVIKAPPKLKLSTIVDPYKGEIPLESLQQEITQVLDAHFGRHRAGQFRFGFTWRYSQSAGPNGRAAVWSAPWDALAFFWEPKAFEAFASLAPWWITMWVLLLGFCTGLTPSAMRRMLLKRKPIVLGRLSEKEEAAGKVRVFAITDWWTQGLLAGLHKFLFSLLRGIEEDGTFDQLAPLTRLLDRVRLGLPTYSYDLSAATDRLPVALQVQVLRYFTKYPQEADLWAQLLVGRAWHHRTEGPLYYAVGQPMGALSSWAMLALTHHVLVQVSAHRVGHEGWFSDYAVLGDDIVIANEGVAAAYLHLMSQLGVEISMAKSLISEAGFVEFAKRLMSPAYDYTPLGPGALLGAWRNPAHLPALAADLADKGFTVLPQQWLGHLGDIVSHYPKSKRGLATQGVFAAVGPSGGLVSELHQWIPFGESLAGVGSLHPAVNNALQGTLFWYTAKQLRSAAKSITARWNELLKAWQGTAIGLPWPIALLAPGPWVYSYALYRAKQEEITNVGTHTLPTGPSGSWSPVNWDNPTAAQVRAHAQIKSDLGPNIDKPSVPGSSRGNAYWARLREETLKLAKLPEMQPTPAPVVVWKPRPLSLVAVAV